MKSIENRIQRNLVIFTIVVLFSGWVGQGVNIFLGMPSEESLGMLLWMLAPFLATLLLRTYGGDGWKNMGLRPLFQSNVKGYIFSILVFPILTIFVIISGISLGWISLEGLDVQLYLQVFLLALIPNFFKNILEETIVFVEIWFLTRSIWPPVLMHMMEDSFINPLLLDAHISISSGKEIWIHPVLGICSIGLYLIVGLGLRKVRKKKEFNDL